MGNKIVYIGWRQHIESEHPYQIIFKDADDHKEGKETILGRNSFVIVIERRDVFTAIKNDLARDVIYDLNLIIKRIKELTEKCKHE